MSVVGISCSYVDDVQRSIGKAKSAINDVKTNLNKARSELSQYSGDSRISSDYSTINSKIRILDSDLSSLDDFQRKFNNFVNDVKEADRRCARSIKSNSRAYNSADGIPNRSVMTAIAGILNKTLKTAKKLLKLVFNAIVITALVYVITKQTIKDFYSKNIKPWLLNKGKQILNSFKQWIKNGYKYIKTKIKQIVTSGINIVVNTAILIVKATKAIGSKIKDAGNWIWDRIKDAGNWIWDNKGALIQIVTGAIEVGAAIISIVGTSGISTPAAVASIVLGANDIISGIVDLCDTKKDGETNLLRTRTQLSTQAGMDIIEFATGREIPDNVENFIVGGTGVVYDVGTLFISIGGIDKLGSTGDLVVDIGKGMQSKWDDVIDTVTDIKKVGANTKNIFFKGTSNSIDTIKDTKNIITNGDGITSSWNYYKDAIDIAGKNFDFETFAYTTGYICDDIKQSLSYRSYELYSTLNKPVEIIETIERELA